MSRRCSRMCGAARMRIAVCRGAHGEGEARIMDVGLGSAFPQGGDVLDSLDIAAGHDLVLIDTPDGPKRLRMVEGTRVGERQGRSISWRPGLACRPAHWASGTSAATLDCPGRAS